MVPLLASHPAIRTRDLDEARDQVGRIFCPHRLDTVAPDGEVNLTHNRLLMGDVALNYVDYGRAVHIEPGELHSFYLVQMPLSGYARVRSGSAEIVSTPNLAAVPNPTDHLDMVWMDSTPHLVVYLSRSAVESGMQHLTGSSVSVPLRFELGMDLESPGARTWRGIVDLFRQNADSHHPDVHPIVRAQIQELLVLTLLTTQRHNYSHTLASPAQVHTPRSVRRAMDMCESRPADPITIAELATEAGVSVRSLQESFRKYTGVTPLEYLRDVRLRKVRSDLLDESQLFKSVAEIAYSWGFTNLGRFAREYRERFGELPSVTVKITHRG